jgi:FF domain/WW domain
MLKSTYRTAEPAIAEPALPEGWTEHIAPTGHKYYYNVSTKQSTYNRPAPEQDEPLPIDFNATQPDLELRGSLLAQDEFQKNQALAADPRGQSHFTGGRTYQEHSRRRGHGGDRPKTKTSITNCEPWVLIKTRFGRRFVHNTETKQSLWKFPQDVMMKVIEMDRMEWEAKQKAEGQGQSIERPQVKTAETQPETAPPAEGNYDSDEYEEVEVTDDEGEDDADPSLKRPRLSSKEPEVPPGPVEFDEDDIQWQLATLAQEEYPEDYDNPEPENEEAGLPLTEDDMIALFRSLLDDSHISPYATFEKVIEDNHLIEDDRYTALPNRHRRREVFQDWSRDRVAEAQALNAAEITRKKDDPKVKYLCFLQKSATPKLYWPEFKRKYKREPEMKDYGVPDKEREKLYREYVQKIKGSESERRKDFLTLLKTLSTGEMTRRSGIDDLPDSVTKDLRFYLLDEEKRDELLKDFISTLGD